MKLNDSDKQKYMDYFREFEGQDFDEIIKVQIQVVIRETARLAGLLEGGEVIAGVDSPDYKLIKETASSFLNDMIKSARKLHVQLQ